MVCLDVDIFDLFLFVVPSVSWICWLCLLLNLESFSHYFKIVFYYHSLSFPSGMLIKRIQYSFVIPKSLKNHSFSKCISLRCSDCIIFLYCSYCVSPVIQIHCLYPLPSPFYYSAYPVSVLLIFVIVFFRSVIITWFFFYYFYFFWWGFIFLFVLRKFLISYWYIFMIVTFIYSLNNF